MAHYHHQTTFCEVTYDSDWLSFEDDRHLTPYRYSLMRNDTDSNSDTVSLTLPSYTYYEYLKSLYDCRSTPNNFRAATVGGHYAPPVSHIGQQGRATTWHAFNKDNTSELSRAVRSEPTRIRPTYPFPSLHLLQVGDSGDEFDEPYLYTDRTKEKLVWMDALNKWIPQKQLHPRPYMSFVGNPPVVEKELKLAQSKEHVTDGRHSAPFWSGDDHLYMSMAWQKDFSENQAYLHRYFILFGDGDEVYHAQTCERFEVHMGKHTSVSQPLDKSSYKQRNNEKREAIRKRAQELAEKRRQQRKAYSTPLYTSTSERKHHMNRARVQSSRSPASLPVSPIHRKEKVPSPKQVWQAEEGPKLQTIHEPKPEPAKREISITLVSPLPEEHIPEDVDERGIEASEKKVSFDEEENAKNAKKEMDLDSNIADNESKLAEQRLIESLEKQRQQQLLEQQKLLAEQQRQENERKEKERMMEEERLRKMKEVQNLQKQPLSTKNQNQENYYENTMNAAGLLFSQEGPTKNDKPKLEEITVKVSLKKEPKRNSKLLQSVEAKNNQNNISKVKENSFDNIEKVSNSKAAKSEKFKSKPKNEVPDVKSVAKISVREEGPVKIMDGLDKIDEELEIDDTDANVKVTRAKKKKGKVAKSKSKAEKVDKGHMDKGARKPKKVEEEKDIEPKKQQKPKPEPPSKPMVAGMGPPKKPVTYMTPATKPVMKEEKLPITKPSEVEVEPIVIEEVKKPEDLSPPPEERRKSVVEIVKKERRDLRKCVKKADEEKPTLPQPNFTRKKRELWVFEADTDSEKQDKEKATSPQSGPQSSLFGTLNPELIEKEKHKRKEQQRRNTLSKLISLDKAAKKLRKPGHLDSSYADELRRLELAEERRKKQMEMYEKLKNRNQPPYGDFIDDEAPRFEDYGFLSKYCIFTKGNIEMYRHAFDAVDDNGVGWLEGEDVMIALRGVNNKLTEAEEEYLYRVLELTGFRITHGADFKMFSVLAALSQRISALDHWMKNLIGQMDFKALEMKMFKCKTLWECNVDKDTNSISIDQLCVELRAGGVSWEHEMEVREKLSHLHALDLLDFLTYVPLFIMIHEAVVQNPLDDTRNK